MWCWQTHIIFVTLVNGHLLHSFVPKQCLEPVQGDLARASHELQEGSPFFLREFVQCRPQPPDLRRALTLPVLLHISFQILQIEVRQAGNHLLQLPEVEYFEQFVGYQQIEPLQKPFYLPFDALAQLVLAYFLNLVCLILVSHRDVAPIGHQVLDLRPSELVYLDWECHVHDALNGILQYPFQRVVLLLVYIFEVLKAHCLLQHLFLECFGELYIHQAAIVQCFADDPADEFEVWDMFWIYPWIFIRVLSISCGWCFV